MEFQDIPVRDGNSDEVVAIITAAEIEEAVLLESPFLDSEDVNDETFERIVQKLAERKLTEHNR